MPSSAFRTRASSTKYGFWLPRVRVEAEYHAPALMSDWLRMRTHIERVGASSVRWQTVVFNERTGEAGAAVTLHRCGDRCGRRRRAARCREPIRAALLACVVRQPVNAASSRVAMLVAPKRIELRTRRFRSPAGWDRRARARRADRRHGSEDLSPRTSEDADADALRSRVLAATSPRLATDVTAFLAGDAVMCVHTGALRRVLLVPATGKKSSAKASCRR